MPFSDSALKRLSITTDRLFLRPVELADAGAVAALMTPTLAATLCEWRHDMSIAELTKRISACRQAAIEGRRIDWAVFVRPELAMIGWIGLGPSRFRSAFLELDCWLGEAFRGAGYGREAVSAATAKACSEFGVDRVETRTCPVNPAGSKFLKQLGIALALEQSGPADSGFASIGGHFRGARRTAKGAVYL